MNNPKKGLHPRNQHCGRYDFQLLVKSSPELARFVSINEHQDESINFADPAAVKALNRALLKSFYGIQDWDIPDNYLCPPIPGRADYIHHIADLMASLNGGTIPRGPAVRVLDIGVGANCVYPLIGHGEYGWSFVGSDIDPVALACAQKTLQANGSLANAVELRLQASPSSIFSGLLNSEDTFDLTICNPPFHSSLEEAQAGSSRKWRNLGKEKGASGMEPILNFGGQPAELWCPGGESEFVRRMIQESSKFASQCRWFSTLLSKEAHLPGVVAALGKAKVRAHKVIVMAQGQKKSRIVTWTFFRD